MFHTAQAMERLKPSKEVPLKSILPLCSSLFDYLINININKYTLIQWALLLLLFYDFLWPSPVLIPITVKSIMIIAIIIIHFPFGSPEVPFPLAFALFAKEISD